MHNDIFANVIPSHYNMGGGYHGHLSLLIIYADYQYHTEHAFITPYNPGELP